MEDTFKDRQDAGKKLANLLKAYAGREDVLVLALPRGGVPVAYEICQKLKLPLDVFIVRKLGVPWHQELAMGAISSGNAVILNYDLIAALGVKEEMIQAVIDAEQKELARRETSYRGNRPLEDVSDKTIILVDDGIATGATMKAAVLGIQEHKPKAIIIAVPVAAASSIEELSPLVEKIVCPLQPRHFNAVAMWYETFPQTLDEEVVAMLENSGP